MVMAFLRIQKRGRYRYYIILRSVRRGNKVVSKTLEWLGRDPDPKRLKRAMEYWEVKGSPERAGGKLMADYREEE